MSNYYLPLHITISSSKTGKKREWSVNHLPCSIGRSEGNDIVLESSNVSRKHAEIYEKGGKLIIRDLKSANGTWINHTRITESNLKDGEIIHIGNIMIKLSFGDGKTKRRVAASEGINMTQLIDKYLLSRAGNIGSHTGIFMRDALDQILAKTRRRYRITILFLGILLIGGFSFVLYQQQRINKLHKLANEIFYRMKDIEIEMARFSKGYDEKKDKHLAMLFNKKRENYQATMNRYTDIIEELGVYHRKDKKEIAILKMARIFGETEIDVPEKFIEEVKRYIKEWQSTDRFIKGINRAQSNGFTAIIKDAIIKRGLPEGFFYIPLQESNFNPRVSGPQTSYGYAKGMWQMIPETAKRYGLKIGPMADKGIYDKEDERHDVIKSTDAAVRYLLDIYSTEAAASGLLVIASYNWGEHRVLRYIRQLPDDPRHRNFWHIYNNFKMPGETRDYVFKIFSAAVIGTNPRLFGFDMGNPLALGAESEKNNKESHGKDPFKQI